MFILLFKLNCNDAAAGGGGEDKRKRACVRRGEDKTIYEM